MKENGVLLEFVSFKNPVKVKNPSCVKNKATILNLTRDILVFNIKYQCFITLLIGNYLSQLNYYILL